MMRGTLFVPLFCAGKVSAVGEMASSVPMPISSTNCGFDEALSLIVIPPLTVPIALAVYSAVIEHSAPGARLLRHEFAVMRNGAPLGVTDENVIVDVPEFVTVTVCGALVVPISCLENMSGEVGENVALPVFRSVVTCSVRKPTSTRSVLPSLLKSAAAMY